MQVLGVVCLVAAFTASLLDSLRYRKLLTIVLGSIGIGLVLINTFQFKGVRQGLSTESSEVAEEIVSSIPEASFQLGEQSITVYAKDGWALTEGKNEVLIHSASGDAKYYETSIKVGDEKSVEKYFSKKGIKDFEVIAVSNEDCWAGFVYSGESLQKVVVLQDVGLDVYAGLEFECSESERVVDCIREFGLNEWFGE